MMSNKKKTMVMRYAAVTVTSSIQVKMLFLCPVDHL